MSRINAKRVPIGVLFLASFYTFGAFIILAWVFIDPTAVSRTIAMAHGFLPVMGTEIVLVVATLVLILAYGLIRLSKWGFILTITYSLYMGLINLISGSQAFSWAVRSENRLHYGNFIFSVLVIGYLLVARRHFFGTRTGNKRSASHPE